MWWIKTLEVLEVNNLIVLLNLHSLCVLLGEREFTIRTSNVLILFSIPATCSTDCTRGNHNALWSMLTQGLIQGGVVPLFIMSTNLSPKSEPPACWLLHKWRISSLAQCSSLSNNLHVLCYEKNYLTKLDSILCLYQVRNF